MSAELILPGMPGYRQAPDFLLEPNYSAIEEMLSRRRGRQMMRTFMNCVNEPEIVQKSRDGSQLHYRYTLFTGFTADEGNLIHIRTDGSRIEPDERFLVMMGNLTGKGRRELIQRQVIHQESTKMGDKLRLYLESGRNTEYVQLTTRGHEYDPGKPRRKETLEDISHFPGSLGRLAVVGY